MLTERARLGRLGRASWPRPVEQGQDALPPGIGGRAEPAVVTDSLKTLRQHLLEKAADKLLGQHPERVPPLIGTIFVFEGVVSVFIGDDPLRAQGRAIDKSREVLQDRLAAAHGWHIHDPLLPPDRSGDLPGVGLGLQCGLEPAAEPSRQDDLRQEEGGGAGGAPAQAVRTQTACGHHTMNMRMELELATPGVEHAQDAQLGPQIFIAPGHVLQRPGAFFEPRALPHLLVRAPPGPQTLGHGEGDEVVRDGQELELLSRDPLGRVGVAALGTAPMIAGVIDKIIPAAVRAAIHLSPQDAGAAVEDGLHRPAMGRKDLCAKLPFVRRPMRAQNLSQ